MKIYFRKFDPRDCYILTSESMIDAYGIFLHAANGIKFNKRLEKLLTDKFTSVIVRHKLDKCGGYFVDFSFENGGEEAEFLLWSNDGIEI